MYIYSFVVNCLQKKGRPILFHFLKEPINEECYYPSSGLLHSKDVDGTTEDGKNISLVFFERWNSMRPSINPLVYS